MNTCPTILLIDLYYVELQLTGGFSASLCFVEAGSQENYSFPVVVPKGNRALEI